MMEGVCRRFNGTLAGWVLFGLGHLPRPGSIGTCSGVGIGTKVKNDSTRIRIDSIGMVAGAI
jgi:hypothetical protein